MTVLADIRCTDMARVLAGNIDAVVTGEAVSGNTGMVEDGRDPKSTVVAVVAIVAGRDVTRRFARRGRAVVTGSAAA